MKQRSPIKNTIHDQILTYQQGGETATLTVGSPDWFAWLENATSFTFQNEEGHFTAHKTQAGNGRSTSSYWRATRRSHGRLYSFYLGASTHLTLQRLQEAVHELVVRAQQTTEPPMPSPSPENTFDVSTDPLLAIKLHIPRLPAQHVSRPRLLALLEQDVTRPLTLISAPAGSGKTTLLAEWASTTALPVAWLSLETTENDPTRFLAYLCAALSRLDQHTPVNTAMQKERGTSWEQEMTQLLNALTERLSGDAALILDDFHLLTSETVHTILLFLLDHLPTQLHLVIGTRADPPLPLARLRARNQVSERHLEELRFVADEVEAFAAAMGHTLSHKTTALLQQRTEGWIAGVQLLLLALRGHTDATTFLENTGGAQRFLQDYFSEEILSQQSPEVQRFLLHTCILDRFCGPLCDAVTGEANGQEQLITVLRANLFLSELDDTQTWYRYHPLFAESLRTHLRKQEPELIPVLYQRASCWYEQQHWNEAACEYALLARDYTRAGTLLEQLLPHLVAQGKSLRLQQWLAQLPPTITDASPLLYLTSLIWTKMRRRTFISTPEKALKEVIEDLEERIQEHAQETESAWADLQPVLPLFQALGALSRGDTAQMLALIREVTPVLSKPESPLTRLIATGRQILLGAAYGASGDLAAAERIFLAAPLPGTIDITFPFHLAAALGIVELYEAQGKLQKLNWHYEDLFRALERLNEPPPLLQTQALVRYAGLLYEWNRLQEAEIAAQKGLDICQRLDSNIPGVFLFGLGTLIRIALAQGHDDKARELLENLEHTLRRWQPPVATMITAIPARLALACNLLEQVERWVAVRDIHFDDQFPPHFQNNDFFDYMTLARLLLARGRSQRSPLALSQTLTLLERMQQISHARETHGWNLEIQVMMALVLHAQGKIKRALHTLGSALAQAEAEGYIRIFSDEGQPMAHLLAQVSAYTTASSSYLQQLQAAITPAPPIDATPQQTARPLLNPLTPREQEVLALLANGLSNQQIAERLVISPNTAKRHIKHLLAKLSVTNRTRAVTRARELGLL
jgi:LuxR family maltose regulon positive regulatory protein